MKSKFLFLISSIFFVLFLSNISAIVVYGDWQDGSQSISIVNGQTVDFSADFFTMSPPMNVNVKLYDSASHLIYSFENNKAVSSNGYSNTYALTQAIYKTTGNFQVVLSGSDSFPSSFSQSIFLTVTQPPANHAPVITSTPITKVDEKANYVYQIVSTDADNDPLVYSLTQSPSWLSMSSSGLVSGIAPSVNSDTNFDVVVQVSDGKANVSQSYVLTVKNVLAQNHPPISNDKSVNTDKNVLVDITLTATDADNNPLTFSIVSNPLYGTLSNFNPSTGKVTYTPNTGFAGEDKFTFKANDGIANSNTATVSITVKDVIVPNNPPVIISTPITKVDEKANYVYQIVSTDADNDVLTYSLAQAPNWLSINSQTGKVSGIAPSVDSDTNFDVTIQVSDGKANTSQSYTIKVKDVSDDNNNDNRHGGSSGTRFIPTQEFETQKYLNQFAPKTIALEEEKQTLGKKSLFGLFLIIFAFLCLALLLVLIIMLVKRSR